MIKIEDLKDKKKLYIPLALILVVALMFAMFFNKADGIDSSKVLIDKTRENRMMNYSDNVFQENSYLLIDDKKNYTFKIKEGVYDLEKTNFKSFYTFNIKLPKYSFSAKVSFDSENKKMSNGKEYFDIYKYQTNRYTKINNNLFYSRNIYNNIYYYNFYKLINNKFIVNIYINIPKSLTYDYDENKILKNMENFCELVCDDDKKTPYYQDKYCCLKFNDYSLKSYKYLDSCYDNETILKFDNYEINAKINTINKSSDYLEGLKDDNYIQIDNFYFKEDTGSVIIVSQSSCIQLKFKHSISKKDVSKIINTIFNVK